MDLNRFFEDLSSDRPVPGGGSASCVAAAMGVALMEMVASLSTGRNEEASVEARLTTLSANLVKSKARLFALAEEDAEGYQTVLEAFRLPKGTKEEQVARKQAIRRAFERAIASPLALMESVPPLLEQIVFLLDKGNRNAFSDVGVAFHLLTVAFEGGKMNVLINLESLNDASLRNRYGKRIDRLSQAFFEKRREISGRIEEWMRPILS